MLSKKSKKGFVLIELVIVIAIIAILATVLVPTFSGLLGSAGRTVDEQLVREINNYLMLEEAINGKPKTVADVQKVLTDNGLMPVKANLANNTIYWIGTENRAIIWTADGDTGSVTYPKEYAEKYASYTEPSADWAKLGDSAGTITPDVVVVAPAEDESLETALRDALKDVPADAEDVVIQLPENAEVTDCLYYLGTALSTSAGNGKDVTVDLNGGSINNEKHSNGYYYALTVPAGGTLTLTNGSMNLPEQGVSSAALAVKAGSSLVLRDMEIVSNGAAIYPESTASEIVIENCKITTTGAYGIGTNRSTSEHVRIVIKNSTISAPGYSAVFMNTSGEIVIEDSTIIGGIHGLAIRAGSAKVSNTTIKVTDTQPGIYSYKNFNGGAAGGNWFGGNALPAAGIVIGCYFSDNTYSGDATVELTNVKIETPDASVLPTVVMAARQNGKIASLIYDSASSVGDVKIYGQDWIGAETTFTHNGTITVNGEERTLGG